MIINSGRKEDDKSRQTAEPHQSDETLMVLALWDPETNCQTTFTYNPGDLLDYSKSQRHRIVKILFGGP